jgi:hypothetical protein
MGSRARAPLGPIRIRNRLRGGDGGGTRRATSFMPGTAGDRARAAPEFVGRAARAGTGPVARGRPGCDHRTGSDRVPRPRLVEHRSRMRSSHPPAADVARCALLTLGRYVATALQRRQAEAVLDDPENRRCLSAACPATAAEMRVRSLGTGRSTPRNSSLSPRSIAPAMPTKVSIVAPFVPRSIAETYRHVMPARSASISCVQARAVRSSRILAPRLVRTSGFPIGRQRQSRRLPRPQSQGRVSP